MRPARETPFGSHALDSPRRVDRGRDLLQAARGAGITRARLGRFLGLGCKGWAAVAADSWTLDAASFLTGEGSLQHSASFLAPGEPAK